MNLSFEALLILGVLGFYLYDSAILVFSNELIFVESYGRWSVSLPSSRWRMMGKLLFFPNPLTADNLIFRTTWSTADNPSNPELEDMSKLLAPVSYLRILVMVLMVLLAIVFPFVIFRLGAGVDFLKVLFLIYFTIINMLCYIYIKRVNLGLDKKTFATLAFDALACPPFAINLLRKISLRHMLCKNPVEFAAKKLEPEAFKRFIEELNKRLSEELECEDEENSPRSLELVKYREKLIGMLP